MENGRDCTKEGDYQRTDDDDRHQPADGLWVDDPSRKQPHHHKGHSRRTCAVATVLLILVLGAIRQILRHNLATWDAPPNWIPCIENPNVNWASLEDSSPCSRRSSDGTLCTYSGNKVSVWCGGYYFQSNDRTYGGSWEWIPLGTCGSLGAIWEDGHDCDELGMDGWEDICMSYGVEELDNVDCAMNQWYGFLSCGGPNFDYENGVFTLTDYDDDQFDVIEDDGDVKF